MKVPNNSIASESQASVGMAQSHRNTPPEYILLQPTTFLFDMKDLKGLDGVVWSDTYHGTRMNQKALLFHTQLHEWGESQKISAKASKHVEQLSKSGQKEVYLPIQKLTDITYWTRDVNKYYLPNRGGSGRTGSFMKIDVSKYNMKVGKKPDIDARSKSAIYTRGSAPGFRVFSAVSKGTFVEKRRFFGTDLKTVNNNLVESQLHYSAQRRNVYNPVKRLPSAVQKADEPEENDVTQCVESISDSSSTIGNTSSSKLSNADDGISEMQPIEKDIMQPHITSRSWSNRMLNVISIDDCKLTCRYRPQTIKETQTKPPTFEKGRKQIKKGTKSRHKETDEIDGVLKPETSGTSNDADDEDGNSEGSQNIEDGRDAEEADEGLDRNNNETQMNDIENSESVEKHLNLNETNMPEMLADKDPNKNTNIDNQVESGTGERKTKRSKLIFLKEATTEDTRQGLKSDRADSHSNETSKGSYGRITTLYPDSLPSENKSQTKKKPDRRAKVKLAINNMVSERRVMNSMDRDFDTRTAQFGRTTFDRTDGSETFQKIHSNLRKRIDTIIDNHSVARTQHFYENRRKNSANGSVHSQHDNS